jgi:hypothetical protein
MYDYRYARPHAGGGREAQSLLSRSTSSTPSTITNTSTPYHTIVIMLSSKFTRCCILVITIGLSSVANALDKGSFDFRRDSREDCADQKDFCRTSESIYFECPRTCSEDQGGHLAKMKDPDALYDIRLTTKNGKTLEMEDLEGFVTIFAIMPLYPGMTQFYYEMLEHIRTIYKYTTAAIVLPIYKEETGNHLQILPHEKSDTIILQPTDLSSASEIDPLLVHLLNGALLEGSMDNLNLNSDKVTIFVISAQGTYTRRMVAPTMLRVQQTTEGFLTELASVKDQRKMGMIREL